MITEQEFKEVFKLDDKCIVEPQTLKSYTRQIKGAYLLYQEILKISNKKFKNFDGTELVADFEPYSGGFQSFVNTLGSRSKFHVSYIDKNKNYSVPFWTYTKYDNDTVTSMKNAAYQIFISTILMKLKFKYSKYEFTFNFRDLASKERGCHPNHSIWWDGITFNSLYYIDENGKYRELSDYSITQTITNRSGIWEGNILEPIAKIISKIKK